MRARARDPDDMARRVVRLVPPPQPPVPVLQPVEPVDVEVHEDRDLRGTWSLPHIIVAGGDRNRFRCVAGTDLREVLPQVASCE